MLRKIRRNYKRLVAFLLSAAMIITNVGGNAGTVLAAESQEERESSIFMVDGQEILEAVGELGDQEALDKEALEELGPALGQKGAIKKYEKLFLPEEGKVYELTLKIDLDLALEGTALQVFYNTKTKEVIFLYQNESGQAVDCCVNIDGYETKAVTVEANEANVSAEDGSGSEEENGEAPDGNGAGSSSGGSGSSGSGSGSGDSSSGGSNGSNGESSEDASGGSGDESFGGQSGDSGDEGSGSPSSGSGDERPEDGTGKEAIGEESKEDAPSADPAEKDGGEDNQDKNSEGKNPGEDSKADEDGETKGSGKEESKADGAEDDGKEESKVDGAKDEGKEESRVDGSKDNAKEESKADDGKDSAKEETKAEENGDRNDQPGKETDGGKQEEGKPGHGASSKDEENGDGSSKEEGAGKEENSDKEEDGNGSKDEEKPDKGDSKEEGVDQGNKDAADKEDSGETSDDKGVKEDSGEASDDKGVKEDSGEASDDKGVKEGSVEASDDKGVKEGSGNKSDDQGEKENVSGGSGNRDSGERRRENTPSLSLSRHQAVAVAINLDEVREGEGAEEDRAKETDEEETEEKTTAKAEAVTEEEGEKEEKETTAAKETEKKTEKESAAKEETTAAKKQEEAAERENSDKTSEPAVKVETVGEAADEEMKAGTTEAAEQEAKDETVEAAGKETKAEISETAEEEAKAEPEKTIEKMTEAEGAKEESEAKDEAEGTETKSADSTSSTDENESKPAEEGEEEASKEESDNQGGSDRFSAGSSGADSQEITDDWEIPGRIYDTITIRETVNARAYCVALEDVQRIVEANQGAEAVSNEFQVSYRVNPAKAAEVKGDQLVAEGESLCFGVEPKEGYELAAVYANGDVLEAADAASLADSSAWDGYTYVYQVEEVVQALDIEIELEEAALAAQAAVYTAETDDAEFTVNVPDGAFTEEVILQVAKIEDEKQLSDLADQAEAALEKQQTVSSLLAYDISFISQSTGKEVEPAEAVSVSIRVKEPIAAEQKAKSAEKEATGVSVVHLPEDGKAEVVAATENVQETNFEFEAESFSIFVVATVAEAEGTAIVGDKRFDTLQAAIDAVDGEDNTIYLLHDVAENIVSSGKNYVLDLGGFTITNADAKKNIYKINGGTVVIQNGIIDGDKLGSGTKGKGIYVTQKAKLALENCAVKRCSGSGIYASSADTVTIDSGSEITENTSGSGGGIYLYTGSLAIKGGSKITNNTASSNGYGIYVGGGDISINDAEISGNGYSNDKAVGVFLSNSNADIRNAVFSKNGGFRVENRGEKNVLLNHVSFNENKGESVLYISNHKALWGSDIAGEFKANDCRFFNNHVTGKYAVVFLSGKGAKTFEECMFQENSGTNAALGVIGFNSTENYYCNITVDGCEFLDNNVGKAGAIYNNGKANIINVNHSFIAGNTGNQAGAIYTNDGTNNRNGSVRVADTIIKNNIGAATGGIYVSRGKFQMDGGALYDNICQEENHDVKLGNSVAVNILAAKDMKDEEVNFGGYVWKQVNGAGTYSEALKANSGNWYAFKEKSQDVVQIGGTAYGSISEALKAAKDGDVIKLTAESLPVEESLIIDHDITIDMNGCKLLGNFSSRGSNGIYVQSGKSLTFIGTGESDINIGVRLGGKLNLNGNAVFTGTIQNEGSLVLNENAVLANAVMVRKTGKVTVSHWLDAVEVKLDGGSFELPANVAVGKLTISENDQLGISETVINGSVDELELGQSGLGAKATLNGKIGTLKLGHYKRFNGSTNDKSSYPETYAGKDFYADKMVLTPAWDSISREDAINPEKEMDDIVVIQGLDGEKIREDQVNLEQTTWTDPFVGNGSGVYKFLIKIMLSEDGNIILHKSNSDGIYLDGTKGKDEEGYGWTADKPVQTFAEAKKLLESTDYPENVSKTIWIVGAVTIKGAEEWTLSGKGMVQRYPFYTSELIRVQQGGSLILQDITIDGSRPKDGDRSYLSDRPIIMNEAGGTLEIRENAVLQNNYNQYRNVGFEGGAIRNAGKLVMQGGSIQGNHAVSGGGIFNCGEFIFSGGKIKDNHAEGTHTSNGVSSGSGINSAGGGVFIAKSGTMRMTGGEISENSAYIGGGISLGNEHNVYVGGELFMESSDGSGGGSITGNVSNKEGGGIFVQMGCKAEITAGSITGNTSNGGDFGGGGIYVNGGDAQKAATGLPNGVLTLKNVKISENTASASGGGIAACPSSGVKLYLKNGGMICNNNGGKGDVYIDNTVIQYIPRNPDPKRIYISRYMHNGELYKWKYVEDDREVPAKYLSRYFNSAEGTYLSIYSAATVEEDEGLSVFITGNKAPQGGGIGSNGEIIIGDADEPDFQIQVKKIWQDENGKELSPEELKDVIDSSIDLLEFKLWRRLKGSVEDPDEGWELVESGYSGLRNGVWQICTFNHLQKKNKEGKEWEYKITETSGDAFINVKNEWEEDSDNSVISVWKAYNQPVYSLKVMKTVRDMYGQNGTEKERFTFTITLKDKNGNPYQGEIKAVNQDDEKITVIANEQGQIKHSLGDGEFIRLEGLLAGTKYSIEEQLSPGYDASSSGINGTIIGSTVKETEVKPGENLVEFVNTTKEPHGNLTISKEVSGKDGDKEKEWHFTVKLTKVNDKGEEVALEPSGGKIYEFLYEKYERGGEKIESGKVNMPKAVPGTANYGLALFTNEKGRSEKIALTHNQYVIIYGLPLGTGYAVVETEADRDHYKTEVEDHNATGVINQDNQEVSVKFINTRETGSLSIQKTVTGQKGDKTKRFNFTITLTGKDGQPLTGTYPYTGSVTEEGAEAPPSGSCTFNAKGEAQISLRHGQKVTFTGIPAGVSYKVTEAEANQDGYTTKETDAEGTLVKDGEKTARFVNDKPDVPEETTPTEPDTPEETTPTEPDTPEETTPTESGTPEETAPTESAVPEETTPAEPTAPEETSPTEPSIPEETTPPENPTTPARPSGGGGGGRDRDRNPSLTPEPEPIPPEEVPLTNINPEDVPLAMMPSESPIDSMVIDDEGVPLFGLPRTGDRGIPAGGLIGMMLLSLMAACGIHVRKREEEE